MDGRCDAWFLRVGEEFERNFTERGKRGASLCVLVGLPRRALGGRYRSVRLLGADDLARIATTVSAGLDDTVWIRTRFSST